MNSTNKEAKPTRETGEKMMETIEKIDNRELGYQIQALFRNDRTLTHLDVSCQAGEEPILDQDDFEAIADGLKNNTKLTHLNLSGNDFNDEYLEYLIRRLYHNNKLKSLNLANTQITAKGLEALSALMFFNTQIIELNLNGTPAMQDKKSAKSYAIIKQALVNNREYLDELAYPA